MFDSIYKKIINDFDFLKKYGFSFKYKIESYIHPSIIFTNKKDHLQIGMNYEERKIFVYLYENYSVDADSNVVKDILNNINLSGKEYKNQVAQVVKYLENYFA